MAGPPRTAHSLFSRRRRARPSRRPVPPPSATPSDPTANDKRIHPYNRESDCAAWETRFCELLLLYFGRLRKREPAGARYEDTTRVSRAMMLAGAHDDASRLLLKSPRSRHSLLILPPLPFIRRRAFFIRHHPRRPRLLFSSSLKLRSPRSLQLPHLSSALFLSLLYILLLFFCELLRRFFGAGRRWCLLGEFWTGGLHVSVAVGVSRGGSIVFDDLGVSFDGCARYWRGTGARRAPAAGGTYIRLWMTMGQTLAP
jgi:hypothetical protein